MAAPKSIESTTHCGITLEETTMSTWKVAAASHRERGTTATSSREVASAVRSNAWEYISADGTVENRARETGEAVGENREDAENGLQASVSPQHFGAFDRTASL